MSTPHSIVVHGASGRMGRRIVALAASQGCSVAAALVREGSASANAPVAELSGALRFTTSLAPAARVDAVIDFSSPAGARHAANLAVSLGKPLVCGTTGLSPDDLAGLRAAATSVPVLVTPNTSAGVTLLAIELARIARALGPSYRASIVEAHHIHKKDAPSGTAKRLAEAVRAGGGQLDDDQVFAVRAGDIVGEHTIRFAGPGEELVITHRATTRDLFALGALRAARWIITRPAGWYSMEQLLESPGS